LGGPAEKPNKFKDLRNMIDHDFVTCKGRSTCYYTHMSKAFLICLHNRETDQRVQRAVVGVDYQSACRSATNIFNDWEPTGPWYVYSWEVGPRADKFMVRK
jgi:hypothetical protein